MQFSIFGVLFKCTKDMFTLEKIKWSIFVYWAQFWRGLFLGSSFAVVLFVSLFAHAEFLEVLADVNNDMNAAMVYLFNTISSAKVLAILCGSIATVFLALYIQFYTLFRKSYKSFQKAKVSGSMSISFFGWSFWKVLILTMLLGGVFGLVLEIALQAIDQTVGAILQVLASCFLFHIYIHGGTWGFVPVRRQTKIEESEVKS